MYYLFPEKYRFCPDEADPFEETPYIMLDMRGRVYGLTNKAIRKIYKHLGSLDTGPR